MILLKRRSHIFIILALSLTFFSCSKDDKEEKSVNSAITSIDSYLLTDSNLSEFNKAWVKTDLKNSLEEVSEYTILAPVNQAFIDASINVDDYTTTEEISELKKILLNHIIISKIKNIDFTNKIKGYEKTLAINNNNNKNLSIYFNTESSIKFNNTSIITESDIEISIGIMHKVDQLIPLPTIDVLISSDVELTDFKKYTSLYFPFWETNNTDTKGGTVFACVDGAFDSYIKPELDDLENSIRLYDFLKDNHVSNTMLTSLDLKAPGTVFTSYADIEHYTTFIDDVITIESIMYDVKASVVQGDIQATNGIIHKVDNLLGATLFFDFS